MHSERKWCAVSTTLPQKLRQRWPLVVGGFVVLLVAAILLVFATGNQARIFPFLSDTIPTDSLDIGEGIVVSGEKVPSDLEAKPSGIPMPEDLQVVDPANPWFEQLLPAIDIGPSGQLEAPMTIVLPLPRQVTDADTLVVLTQSEGQPWRALPYEMLDGQHVKVVVGHLSLFTVFSAFKDKLLANLKDAVDAASGGTFTSAEKPECADKAKFNADGYAISSRTSRDTVFWCYGFQGTDRVIKVVNNRRYPLEITTSGGLPVIDSGPVPFSLAEIRRLGHTVIMPREMMVFGVNPLDEGAEAKLDTQVSNWSLGYQFIETVGLGLAKYVKGASKSEEAYAKLLELMVTAKGCYANFDAADFNMYQVIVDCFDETVLTAAFGATALLVLAVVPAIAAFDLSRAIANATGDRANNRDKYGLTVTRQKPADLGAFVGEWFQQRGDDINSLVVSSDGSASITMYCHFFGPEGDTPAGECILLKAKMSAQAAPDGKSVVLTYTSIQYLEGNADPDPIRKGDTARLTIGAGGILKLTFLGRLAGRTDHFSFSDSGIPGYCRSDSNSNAGCSPG